MPAFVPAPGVIQLAAIWTMDNQRIENTFHYHASGAIDLTLLTAIAVQYETWASAHTSLWCSLASLTMEYLRDLTTQAGITTEHVPPAPIQGFDGSRAYPNNVAFAVKRITGHAGRANRGRVYHFGIAEDMTSAQNNAGPVYANNLVTAYTALMNGMASGPGVQEVLLHKASGTFTPVAQYSYSDLTLDSQRRRLPGHNIHH